MKIYLEELANAPNQEISVYFDEIIDELHNNSYVKGSIIVKLTDYGVKVEGHVQTEMPLECDRCLENFVYKVEADLDEKFVKDDFVSENSKEIELKSEDFVEELKGRDHINITDLVYQNIIINLPSKGLCDTKCSGSPEYQKLKKEKPVDPRLEIFKKMSEQENGK